MNDSFFAYLELLETLAFFAGYPLLFALVYIAGRQWPGLFPRGCPTLRLLAIAYGITGLLFLGLQMRNLYPDYSLQHIRQSALLPGLKLWALSSAIFLLPALSRRPLLSLLHGMVFFFFVARDIVLKVTGGLHDPAVVKNDMNMMTNSLLLIGACWLIVLAACVLLRRLQKSA